MKITLPQHAGTFGHHPVGNICRYGVVPKDNFMRHWQPAFAAPQG
jgi:hypothetical protein